MYSYYYSGAPRLKNDVGPNVFGIVCGDHSSKSQLLCVYVRCGCAYIYWVVEEIKTNHQ